MGGHTVRAVVFLVGLLLGVTVLSAIVGPGALVPGTQAQDEAPRGPLTDEHREWLAENGPLRIAAPLDRAPATFLEEGTWRGYAVDLLWLAALQSGFEVEFVAYENTSTAIQALADGDVPIAAAFGPREQAKSEGLRPGPTLAWVRIVWFTNEDHADYRSEADLDGARVAAPPGTYMAEHIQQNGIGVSFTPLEPAEGVQALARGDIDAYLGTVTRVGHQIRTQDVENVHSFSRPLATVRMSVWSHPDNQVPREIIEAALGTVSHDEAALIHIEWTGLDLTEPQAERVETVLPGWVPLVVSIVVAATLLLVLLNVMLRREVRRRTAALRRERARLADEVERQTQVLRTQKENLEESNRALDRFAYAVSHDLRSPLRNMMGFLGLLERRLASHLDERNREAMDWVLKGAKDMDNMIEGMLRVSRLRTSPLKLRQVDLEAVAHDAFVAIESSWTVENARLTVDRLPEIVGDQVLLRNVFQNLFNNAFKYRDPDRPLEVTVTGREMDPDGDGENEVVEISIADNGTGIYPNRLQDIFAPFRQVNTDEAEKGVGLGLTICQTIVDRHGGRIWAESEGIGNGSTFRFTLPKFGPPGEAVPPADAENAEKKEEKDEASRPKRTQMRSAADLLKTDSTRAKRAREAREEDVAVDEHDLEEGWPRRARDEPTDVTAIERNHLRPHVPTHPRASRNRTTSPRPGGDAFGRSAGPGAGRDIGAPGNGATAGSSPFFDM